MSVSPSVRKSTMCLLFIFKSTGRDSREYNERKSLMRRTLLLLAIHFQQVMAGLTSEASNSRLHLALGMEAKYPAFACFGGQSVYCEQPDPEVKRSEAKFLLQGSAQTQPLILAIQIHFSAFQRIFHSLSVVRCRFKV